MQTALAHVCGLRRMAAIIAILPAFIKYLLLKNHGQNNEADTNKYRCFQLKSTCLKLYRYLITL
jgi:hypothetical protein